MKAIQLNGSGAYQDELSNSIEDLNEISSQFCANEFDHRIILNAYRTRLEQINDTLAATEYTGIINLITIFIEGVEALVESGREINNEECRFLLQFPNMLVEYFSLPLSKLPGKLLVRFFKNPEWVRPISDTEENDIYEHICKDTDKVDASYKELNGYSCEEFYEAEYAPDCDVDTSAVIDESEDVVDLSDEINDQMVIKKECGQSESELSHTPDQTSSEYDAVSILDFIQPSHEKDNDIESELSIETENELDSDTCDVSLDFNNDEVALNDLLEGDNESIDITFFAESSSDDVAEDLSDNELMKESEEEGLIELIDQVECETEGKKANIVSILEIVSSDSEPLTESNDEPVDAADIEPLYLNDSIKDISVKNNIQSNACDIDENQQLLIDLVRAELAEVIDSRDEDLTALKSEEDADHKKHLLINYSEQAENISNAVKLIGLDGLSLSSEFISENIAQLAGMSDELNEAQLILLYEWPVKLFSYLQDINNEKATKQLFEFLNWDSWSVSLSEKESDNVLNLLMHPVLEEEEKIERQAVASEEDVSIELPEDVNQELLEGLLHDLPQQSEEFSNAIEHLKTSGNKEDIETAQRIAHTLKGAANVVGVKGVASLTHHLEDILDYLSCKEKQPTEALLEVLSSASDCLESMTESLLGIDAAPEDAVAVLQDILDWANLLDQKGLPDNNPGEQSGVKADINSTVNLTDIVSNASAEDSEDETNEDKRKSSAAENNAPIVAENVLRIPVNLADELLRIAGESLISNTQIEDKVKNSLKRQEILSQHSSVLQQISFDLEQLIDIQGITTNFSAVQEEGFDALEMDKFHELHSVSRRLVEITSDSMQLSQTFKSDLNELKNLVIDQDKLQKNNQDLVLRTRMVPVKSIAPRLKRGVRQACRLTGKSVDLNFLDNNTYMDSEVLNEMIEPLMHILRNAVDHGVESVEERKAQNKNERGTINIIANQKGDQVVIKIEDDGRGLDQKGIYEKAKNKNLISVNQDISEEGIYRLILEPGFSTRDEVTQTSGRGIGLDVVNIKLRQLKGSINIESPPGKGTIFEIVLPVSSFSTHSLMVQVREYVYAISNRGVEEVLYPGTGELKEVGKQLFYKIDDEAYEAVVIDDLLNLPPDRRTIERNTRPVVIVKDDVGERHAILVQSVLDSRDVVVKSMGQYMPKIHGIIGATVLGNGSIAPVVDLPEMIRDADLQQKSASAVNTSSEQSVKRAPYVLVVDDSLSARRSLAQFTADLGMNTRTARDGMEAVAIIESRIPDLILVDMEMPRMNGLELTAHIRANEKTRHVPVIMITSRSTEKHKATAMNKGVNYYMVKPFDEDALAVNINEALELKS